MAVAGWVAVAVGTAVRGSVGVAVASWVGVASGATTTSVGVAVDVLGNIGVGLFVEVVVAVGVFGGVLA